MSACRSAGRPALLPPGTILAGFALAAMLALAVPASSAAPAAALPAGITHLTTIEGIEEYHLDNGLRLLLFPDPSVQTTTVNITYLVGSLNEGYGETGMAHLLEHLLFKGSTHHTDIPQELTAHGARPNGSTWYDRTNYFETFSATDENLVWALDLEADRMVNSFIAKKDLDSEMTVVRNEFEIDENNSRAVLEERVYSTAYLWHNYGNSTIGARSDIEDVPIERLQAFYHTWYRPDNAVLVVAGKFDRDRTLELVKEKFGSIQPPATPLPQLYTVEPAQDGERTVTLRRVGDEQIAMVAYHIPAGSHPDNAAAQVLAYLLGDEPSGRLHKSLVETGMATSVAASADHFRDAGLLVLSAEMRTDSPVYQVRDDMIQQAETFAATPPAAEEVDRAKRSLLKRWELTMRDSPRAAIRLSEWAAMGDWRMLFLARDALEAVTPDDVVRVANAYLQEANRTVGLFIPSDQTTRVQIPPTPDLSEKLASYTGGEGMAAGESFDASPENIQAHLIEKTLPAGMKVVMLPKKTRGETVNMVLQLHMGDEKNLRGKAEVGELTASMLERGTQTRSRQEIADEIDRLKAQIRIFGRASGVTATVSATRETLPDALRLVADVLRNPTFPEGEFKQVTAEETKQQEEAKSDPFAQAFRAFQRHMSPWPKEDVRYTMTPEEAIDAIGAVTVDDMRAFHRDFYGASNAELAVVGDFDADQIAALAGELFGDWKSNNSYQRLSSPSQDRPALVTTIETPDKESAVLSGGVRFAMRDDSPDYPDFTIANFMAGGGFLNSRFATRIRRTDGLSYGVRSRFDADSEDKDAWFTLFAIYAPQNDEKLVRAFNEEIDKIITDGFKEDELKEAKTGWLQSRDVARGDDGRLAMMLADHARIGRDMAWEEKLDRAVDATTTGGVQKVFRKYVDPAKVTMIRAGDFARVADMEGAKAKAEEKTEHAAR